MPVASSTLWTIGHSTRPWEDFLTLLQANAIVKLVDVRRFAGSRHNPQYSPDDMRQALLEAGIEYLPMPALGGRREAAKDSHNGAWRVAAFRGYADYMATPEFVAAREQLMSVALSAPTAVMCAEAVWWRCHRRLIADDFTARGWNVLHIMAPGKVQEHVLNVDARMVDGVLCYPAPADAQHALL
ncbi:MAG: DUF488 domain-containing protein [Luteimonas sp.]